MDTQRESDGNKYVTLVLIDESKKILKRMKNYGKKKSDILLDPLLITQSYMMTNI